MTLPLNGYCKPGRYFPIRLDGEDAAHPTEFTAVGCLSLNVQASKQSQYVVPMLATDTPTELRWPNGSTRLIIPKDNEQLIACTAASPEISQISPQKTAIPILLDPADPLPGPASAWESLDAIVLNTDLMARINDDKRATLLAGGVMLAAIGTISPDVRWPWRQKGGLWILNFPIVGPVQSIDETAYLPTFGWTPGWPASIRWQVFCAGLLVTVVTLALLSWRHRLMRMAVPVFILCFTAAICAWRQTFDPLDRIGGDIIVKDGKLLQRDQWVYQRAKSDCVAQVPWQGLTHPIFTSSTAMENSEMRLNVSNSGELKFTYHAAANHTLGFVRREISNLVTPENTSGANSPMKELAKKEYLQRNSTILGELESSSERWPSVLIERR